MEALIQGLIERTASLLPLSNKASPYNQVSASAKLYDLRQNAAALIKLAKYKQDAVIEGLLHLYSYLLKTYQSALGGDSSTPSTAQPSTISGLQRMNSVANMDIQVASTAEEKELIQEKFIRSKLIIFQLFSRTLSAAIGDDKLDLRFDDDFMEHDELYNREEEEKLREEKEKKQQEEKAAAQAAAAQAPPTPENEDLDKSVENPTPAAPIVETPAPTVKIPTLEYSLANSLLKYILETLFPAPIGKEKEPPKVPQHIKYLAARVLFKLSVVNFDTVFSRIENFFKNMKSDEVEPSIYAMIEYINFDSARLIRLISLLNDVSAKFKKHAYVAMAQPLRAAIWNWINNYPHQFIKLCQNKGSLACNPMKLFENMYDATVKSDKKGRQGVIWPTQNMLLLLSPEILSGVIMAIKKNLKNDTRKKQRQFLQTIKDALVNKEKNTVDIALVCFVDLYKASTYLSKSDLSALRFLVSDVQNQIQDILMNVETIKPDGKITVRLMVDFLFSAYRINQRNVTSYIFPLCFRGSSLYKLVMTKAMLKLVQEGAALPWHPTLNESYAFLAKPVRLLFQDLLQEERQLQTKIKQDEIEIQKSGKKAKLTAPLDTYCTETLLNLLAVFYTDPRLALENTSGNATQHINDILYLFIGLCNCLGDQNNISIQNQAYRLLQKLFDSKYIEKWCPQDVASGFIELSSSVLTQLSVLLFQDKDLLNPNIKTLLELCKELTSSANRFFAIHKNLITVEHLKSRKRIQSLEHAEATLLVMLCSSEPEIWSTAASCFGDLCDQIDILGDKEVKANTIYCNYNLYRKISQLIEDNAKGRTQQQKGIRKLLRRVELQTKANFQAYIEVYSRWKVLTSTLTGPQSSLAQPIISSVSANPTPQSQQPNAANKGMMNILESNDLGFTRMKQIWKNYTAFLCSLGGICLQAATGVFASSVASKMKGTKDNARMTDELMRELMKYVGSPITFIRDGVTQTIGNDLSPALYGCLFQHLHAAVAQFFGEEGTVKVTESSTLFMDQSIFIVKSILEQAAEGTAEDLALANFETLIMSFVKYCSQLVLGDEAIDIRRKLCVLIETMMNRKEFITFTNELEFRFNCLRYVVEWTSDFALKSQEAAGSGVPAKANFFKDLDVLCLRAIASLLKDLALSKLKRDKKISTREREEINKKEFFKYFSFLSRYLQKSKTDKDALPQLREFTIASLGNLLESNINYGLEHFMKMAYIEDQETRSAFLAVLNKIMKQGIQLDSDEEANKHKKKYDRLLDFLSKINPSKPEEAENLEFLFTLFNIVSNSEQDAVAKTLVRLTAEKNATITLLKAAIDQEVKQTLTAGTLFRANSLASKMLTAYCNWIAKDFMTQVLAPHIQGICNNPVKYEVDPSKIKQGEDVQSNCENLMNICQAIIDSVISSAHDIPKKLRHIMAYMAQKVEAKFPSNAPPTTTDQPATPAPVEEETLAIGTQTPKLIAIGGLLFLRFLSPAIVTPQNYGMWEKLPSKESLRFLLLTTKIVQNSANGTTFGKKEEFMKVAEPFIVKNFKLVQDFFEQLSAPVELEDVQEEPLEDEVRDSFFFAMHRMLFEYTDKVAQKLQSEFQPKTKNQAFHHGGLERLQSIMADLGKPPEVEQTVTKKDEDKEFTSIHYADFVERLKGQVEARKGDLAKIEEKHFFYKGGQSKTGRPVLYCIGRNYADVADTPDLADLAVYHVLMVLTASFTKPYEILFDCTDLSQEHGLTLAMFTKFHKLVPPGARKNLARLIIYNANSYLKDQSKSIAKYLTKKNTKKIEFVTTVKELTELIEEKNIDLPEYSVEFEKNVQNTFSAHVVGASATLKECIVKISNKKLCVITKKDTILGVETKKVDFWDLAVIDKVKIEKNPHVLTMDQVTVEVLNRTISLKSDINEQLHMAIKSAITRYFSEFRLAASLQTKQAETDTIRQSDIPGSVLNMCFLNLESMFPKTRSAAYNLLAALAEQFDFPVTLLETSTMCVPHNTGDLVVKLSEQVAHAKPFLTPQFLRESLRGFQKISLPYKYLCLKYMRPWIKNLSIVYHEMQDDQEQTKRITEWFTELTKSTIEMNEIYPAVLSEIWGEISQDAALVEISMGCLLKEAIETGLDSPKLDILNDLVVTLASHNASELVTRLIFEKCFQVFDQEVKNTEPPLENNPPWAKIIIYFRFLLMLSFQDRIKVIENVPILFHLITMMIGRGSIYVRATIHALTLNIIHSIATVFKFEKEEKKIMSGYLTRLSTPEYKKIFMGHENMSSDPFVSIKEKEKQKLEPITMWDLETVSLFFLEVMDTCGKVNPQLRNTWHSNWVAICQNEANKLNSILLPRLLAVNGVVVRTEEAGNTLNFVIQCLTASFLDYNPLNANVDLHVSAILCLSNYCSKLSPDDSVLQKLLVIPMILLAASDQTLFPAVVHLFKCILNNLSKSNNFVKGCNSNLELFFNTYCRDTSTDEIVSKLEKSTGVSFKLQFSFALSCLLMKGIVVTNTRERTAQLIASLVKLHSSQQSKNVSDLLGYLAALVPNSNIKMVAKYLPLDEEPLSQVESSKPVDEPTPVDPSTPSTPASAPATPIVTSTVAPVASNTSQDIAKSVPGEAIFYIPDTYTNPNSNLLFVRYLLTIVQNMEFDHDKIILYNVMQQSFTKLPTVFIPVFSHVMPRVIQVYNQASSTKIAEVSLSVVSTMMATDPDAAIKSETDKDPLKEIQFSGLSRAGSFKAITDKQRSECLQLVLEFVKLISGALPEIIWPQRPDYSSQTISEKERPKKKQPKQQTVDSSDQDGDTTA